MGMIVLGTLMLLAESVTGTVMRCETWPAWQRFKNLYLHGDGRIIDASSDELATTSLAQAYTLFFALIANDRTTFDAVLLWTQVHLAGGDLTSTLPASRWGRDEVHGECVLDIDSTTEADLWMAYSLGEAGRLWDEPFYSRLSNEIAGNILRKEVASIPDLGMALLPGSQGFVGDRRWRLKPGGLPLSVIRGIARLSSDPLWNDIAHSSERVLLASAPQGFASDWLEYSIDSGFIVTGGGSFEAIRVYLWAGLLPASDLLREKLARLLHPMLINASKRFAPVKAIDMQTLTMCGDGAPGFSAALLPMFANARMSSALQSHRKRAAGESLRGSGHYYSDMLSLLGVGWLEQRYRFNRAGLLSVRWSQSEERPH